VDAKIGDDHDEQPAARLELLPSAALRILQLALPAFGRLALRLADDECATANVGSGKQFFVRQVRILLERSGN
jgi:hypothetical protein